MTTKDIEERLEEWGATDIYSVETRDWVDGDRVDVTNFDFRTPFPGIQPISSSLLVHEGRVVEATVRYGVLDDRAFDEHPSKDTAVLLRLRSAVEGPEVPAEGIVNVGFGDTHRTPRPHLRFGWTPEGEYIDLPAMSYIRREGYHVPVDADAFFEWMIRAGRRIRQEFRGEWAR